MADQQRQHEGELNMPVKDFAEAIDMHPLWQGAMLVTPIEGHSWHPEDRDDFLRLCKMICGLLYNESFDAPKRHFGRSGTEGAIQGRIEEAVAAAVDEAAADWAEREQQLVAEAETLRARADRAEDEREVVSKAMSDQAAYVSEQTAELKRLAACIAVLEADADDAAIRDLQEANARLEAEIIELRKTPRGMNGLCGHRWTSRSGSGGKGPEFECECELPAGHAGAHWCVSPEDVSPGAPSPVEAGGAEPSEPPSASAGDGEADSVEPAADGEARGEWPERQPGDTHAAVEPPPDGSEEPVTTVDISRMSPESQELLRTAAEIAGQPDAAPPADMTIIGREGFAVDARPCKVDDCDNLAVKRGQWAGICEDDREHLEGGGTVLVDGVPMVLNGRTGRGLVEQGGVNG